MLCGQHKEDRMHVFLDNDMGHMDISATSHETLRQRPWAQSMTNVFQVLGTVKNALVVWMGIIFLAELVTPVQVMHISSS